MFRAYDSLKPIFSLFAGGLRGESGSYMQGVFEFGSVVVIGFISGVLGF